MKIGELSRRAELPPSTLRYYEALRLLPAAKRENGQRVYDENVLERLSFIRVAKAANFSLEEISSFLSSGEADWRPLAEAKMRELEGMIGAYQEMQGVLARLPEHGCPGE